MDAPTHITSTVSGSLDQAGTGVGRNRSSVGLKWILLDLNWTPPGLGFHSNMTCILQWDGGNGKPFGQSFGPDLQPSPSGAFWRRPLKQWGFAAWWSIGAMLQGGTGTARIVPTTTHPRPTSCLLAQNRRGQLAFPVQQQSPLLFQAPGRGRRLCSGIGGAEARESASALPALVFHSRGMPGRGGEHSFPPSRWALGLAAGCFAAAGRKRRVWGRRTGVWL